MENRMKTLKLPILIVSLTAMLGASPLWSAPPKLPANKLNITLKVPKPDLIPILFKPMTSKVAVRNGAAHAGKSLLLIKCTAAQAGGCAENAAMAPYINPAYLNYVVVKIPPLAPGQVYSHVLKFWKTFKWRKGKYRFTAKADGSGIVAESNESNNAAYSWLAK